MAAASTEQTVFKSKRFVTAPMRAVFPHLHQPDQFGNYSVDVDVLEDPEFLKTLKAQGVTALKEGQEKLKSKKKPTNELVRVGEDKEGKPFQRVSFRMKSTRGKVGAEIPQKPRVVDSAKNPFSRPIGGGSMVRIAYYLQYTIMKTGACYLTPKLDSVQVIEYVAPGGGPSIDQLFGDEVEGGYVDTPDEITNDETEGEDTESTPKSNAKSGRDF